jgi:hypothetical protein
VGLDGKSVAGGRRGFRVTYAKKEGRGVKGNVGAARVRLQRKQKRPAERAAKADGGKRTVEGKRAMRTASGGSGFKVSKKRGKMRLLQTDS